MEMTKRFTQDYFVGANDANAQEELGVPVLVSAIIETATSHANSLHIGNPDMRETGGGWILTRLTLEMYRWPRVNESYRLTTWVETFNRHFSLRAFSVTGADGEVLGYARTVWMVIDLKSHRNLGLGHLNFSQELVDGTPAPIEKQARHRPILGPDDDTDAPGALRASTPPTKYRFKYCDLDFYRHVNTVRYIVLLLNQFTLEEMDLNRVRRMELSFMREARYGMTVDIMHADSDNPHQHTFTLCEEGEHTQPLLFARILLHEP